MAQFTENTLLAIKAPIKWIADIKPVEPEEPEVDWSKHLPKPNVEVSDDGENWFEAALINYDSESKRPFEARVVDCTIDSYVHCRLLTPEPVKPKIEFPAPPQGRGWQNPHNLTPEQVEIDKGWRLKLKGEEWVEDQHGDMLQSWGFGTWLSGGINGSSSCLTYRTKHPLPVSEKEEVEFEWWSNHYPERSIGDFYKTFDEALMCRHSSVIATYHIRKVKGKDATIKKVEGV